MKQVALYARVSSERQAKTNTISSQITALKDRISSDGYTLLDELDFIDNGYSGSNLVRPGLEKLRDKVALGEIDRIYICSPDRLSRKYAHQIIIIEEFQKFGTEIIFLNYEKNDSPESNLLLQMQGMIAEYERERIIERNRRGKIYAAKKGSVNILSGAPYGYRYIDKHFGGGQARYEINEQEAELVRKIFFWIGVERLSMAEVCRKLKKMNVLSPRGKTHWGKHSIWSMLRNPAYKGQAEFGKKKIGSRLPNLRTRRNAPEQPKNNYSMYRTRKEDWIYIPVPAIVDEIIFSEVQKQLEENKKITRTYPKGATYLLQGLLVCKNCNYAYCGVTQRRKSKNVIKIRHVYYRCASDSRRLGLKICDNKLIRADALDTAVWEEVKTLLKNPDRILHEYKRRISELGKCATDQFQDALEKQENKINRGISRLIDSYAQEQIDEEEFKPRVKAMKQCLAEIAEQKTKIIDQKKLKGELTLVVNNLEEFYNSIKLRLENLDWNTKRDIIRTLVKRVEIDNKEVNIVFRIKELPDPTNKGRPVAGKKRLQHCWSSNHYHAAN